jgi:hypothetical protein
MASYNRGGLVPATSKSASICGFGPFGSSVGARQPEKSSPENNISSYCTTKITNKGRSRLPRTEIGFNESEGAVKNRK